MTYCRNCGAQINDNAAVCLKCGVALQQTAAGAGEKSKMAAGLLGILVGGFGAHNFYLGFKQKAIIQLVLGLLVVTAPISAVWGLVEGVMILTGSEAFTRDANGNLLKD